MQDFSFSSPLCPCYTHQVSLGDLWITLCKNELKHQLIEMLFVYISPKHDIIFIECFSHKIVPGQQYTQHSYSNLQDLIL